MPWQRISFLIVTALTVGLLSAATNSAAFAQKLARPVAAGTADRISPQVAQHTDHTHIGGNSAAPQYRPHHDFLPAGSHFSPAGNDAPMAETAATSTPPAYPPHDNPPGDVDTGSRPMSGAGADEPTLFSEMAIEAGGRVTSAQSNPMLWQQYQALQMDHGPASHGTAKPCQSCSGPGNHGYDRCGCNSSVFPWISGPGSFDRWCVGPKWGVEAMGLFFFREDVDYAGVTAALGGGNPVLTDQFDHGPGFRLFATAYSEAGFGIQIGYEGINDWNSTAVYAEAPAAGPTITRNAAYESSLNSAEINFLSHTPSPWKLFTGFRYVRLDEDFLDQPLRDAAAPASPTEFFVDAGSSHLLRNNLFGLQAGSRRDAWNFGNRLTIETFANAGVYSNRFKRNDIAKSTTTVIVEDDLATADVNEFSQTSTTTVQTARRQTINEIAFLGEASLSGIWRINPSTSLRAGYQVLAIDGVGQGINGFLAPGSGLNSSTLVFHGLQFGLEYRR